MPRAAILLTLSAATFFGPLLCCCALGLGCPARGLAHEEPTTVATGSCPHCQKTEPTSPGPSNPKHDCPVCEKRTTDQVYVEMKPAPLQAAPSFVSWLPIDTLLTSEPAASQMVEVLPLPDPRTFFLDSCHRLRC